MLQYPYRDKTIRLPTKMQENCAFLAAECFIRAVLRKNDYPTISTVHFTDDEIKQAVEAIADGSAANKIRMSQGGIINERCLDSGALMVKEGQFAAGETPDEIIKRLRTGASIADPISFLKKTKYSSTVLPYSALEGLGKNGIIEEFAKAGLKVSVTLCNQEGTSIGIDADGDSGNKRPLGYEIPIMPTVLVHTLRKGGE
jgi:hypothetical protein